MKKLSTISTMGAPAIIGLGMAWISLRIIKNEKKLISRLSELKIQLNA